MTDDAVVARIEIAIFALAHAKVEATGERKDCLATAIAACADALEAQKEMRA